MARGQLIPIPISACCLVVFCQINEDGNNFNHFSESWRKFCNYSPQDSGCSEVAEGLACAGGIDLATLKITENSEDLLDLGLKYLADVCLDEFT